MALAGCGSPDSPQRLAEQAKTLGVYVGGSGELREIPSFGSEQQDVLSETEAYVFEGGLPSFAELPRFVVVNMPKADISESRLYWLDDIKKARWHYYHANDPRDPKPLQTHTEPLVQGLYKVTPTEGVPATHGYLAMLVKMPLGTPDRLYAVEVGLRK